MPVLPATAYCVLCGMMYSCKTIGVVIQLPSGVQIKCDMHECPGCRHQIFVNFADDWLSNPVRHPDYYTSQ